MSSPEPFTTIGGSAQGVSLAELPKSHVFTERLPPDPNIPTVKDAESKPRPSPGLVKSAAFTWIKPEQTADHELLAVSPAAFDSIGLKRGEEETEDFKAVISGNKIYEEHYPWAQCYGGRGGRLNGIPGYQFGHWAGQLGDGRAISLFESTNPITKVRYEWQLKGAGTTPYSRFADGKAVLRSSIREFIVSEALNALGIPTTRAISLTLLPQKKAQRETVETCAIVCRFAQSWIRVGTFDLPYSRNDRNLTRKLADYTIEEVYGGAENLVHPREVEKDGPPNRYELLYREVVRRNARTVAYWQAYGFMNGVLNTDNTSILGLSLDFGPFSFMDNFDPSFTPNHDDESLRYSYRNQPTIIWWNMVRLGESLAELFGMGSRVDAEQFINTGINQEDVEDLTKRAEGIIGRAGEEYKDTFIKEYRRLMSQRLGFQTLRNTDMDEMFSTALDLMEKLGLDFNHFFRRLSHLPISVMEEEDPRTRAAEHFFNANSSFNMLGMQDKHKDEEKTKAKKEIADWLGKWRTRLALEENGLDDEARQMSMKKVNPKFLPKNWVLDELIQRVQQNGERDILYKILDMSLRPFEDHWGPESEWQEEERLCGDVPPQDVGVAYTMPTFIRKVP
ncbi:hypothetical protein H072_788 [Dactylellina haptotyla CBS 200.50]|uniref:Selenoprotein O n=1 Tax=Dactylellina haptotyla (strain CBS 200.50) TaxID=1284197 RepID=S8CBU1_DACHA|nr:hypothetical protein H072_788 [Dactylellina haptotyla CBS 200.50]